MEATSSLPTLLAKNIKSLTASLSSDEAGNKFDKALTKRPIFIFLSFAKLSRNSSHSSIISKSVFGFLPIAISNKYFIELKIKTSAFA